MSNLDECTLLQQIGRTGRAMYAAFEKDVGHAMPRWLILQALFELKDATQKQLISHLCMDAGALTRQMQTLEQEKIIERHIDQQDNRIMRVCLTALGQQLVLEAQLKRQKFLQKVLAGFDSKRLSDTQNILQQLEQRLRSMRDC